MAAFVIDANLDCEARWSGITLPQAVQRRISLYGALVTALAPAGAEVELWTPAAIDPARLALPWPITTRTGSPARADLRWSDPAAKPANDRRLALAVAVRLGVALPGTRVIDARPGEPGFAAIAELARWVAKAPWTAAGRDRVRGAGPPTSEQQAALARMLSRWGAVVVEPWCDRIVDVGLCASVDAAGAVDLQPPHALVVDAGGAFQGIAVGEPALVDGERELLGRAVVAAGEAIAAVGYAGPFAVDAFAYADAGERRFHPLCEINARYSFGWVARAFARRCGTTALGLAGSPPAGARMLIAPGADGVSAWIA